MKPDTTTEHTSLVVAATTTTSTPTPADDDDGQQQRRRVKKQQRHNPSTVIVRVALAAALCLVSAILLTIALGTQRATESSPSFPLSSSSVPSSTSTPSLGVTREKLAILQGAREELTSAPSYAAGAGGDGTTTTTTTTTTATKILLKSITSADPSFSSPGGGGGDGGGRAEETLDVLDMAGEALGRSTSYKTPFPPFVGGDPRVYTYKVVNKYKHDHTAFTQGLVYSVDSPDTLYESTGSVDGPSSVREVSLLTGDVRKKTELGKEHFAEGLTMTRDGKLAQITWRSNRGFYYDPKTLKQIGEFRTPLEDGWGLATDPSAAAATGAKGGGGGGGSHGSDDGADAMIISDASHNLHFVKNAGGGGGGQLGGSGGGGKSGGGAMTLSRSTPVKDHGRTIRFTNELETVGSEVWANVLERDCIARIDPKTGAVVGWILLSGLKALQDPAPGDGGYRRDDVLNGIAYDGEKDRVFVTGKLWSNVFEIRLQELDQAENLNRARQVCWPAESLPEYGYP